MSPVNEDAPEQKEPDPSGEHDLLNECGRTLARAREVTRRIRERVWRVLGSYPGDRPPEPNPNPGPA
jgi:hypothetical protein